MGGYVAESFCLRFKTYTQFDPKSKVGESVLKRRLRGAGVCCRQKMEIACNGLTLQVICWRSGISRRIGLRHFCKTVIFFWMSIPRRFHTSRISDQEPVSLQSSFVHDKGLLSRVNAPRLPARPCNRAHN